MCTAQIFFCGAIEEWIYYRSEFRHNTESNFVGFGSFYCESKELVGRQSLQNGSELNGELK